MNKTWYHLPELAGLIAGEYADGAAGYCEVQSSIPVTAESKELLIGGVQTCFVVNMLEVETGVS